MARATRRAAELDVMMAPSGSFRIVSRAMIASTAAANKSGRAGGKPAKEKAPPRLCRRDDAF
ncbi:hypothetical protein K32_28500 [Kaistia sp. 32K]|nr:hypothetical protein K32_28500 [Kaistia sp. 32K]